MKHISSKISLLLMCFMLVGATAYAETYKGAVKKPAKKAELERCRRGQGSAELRNYIIIEGFCVHVVPT